MNTRRIREGIHRLIIQAHNGYQQARQIGNQVLQQEQIALNLWRDICKLVYPHNERLRNELYQTGIHNLQNNMERIGELLVSGAVGSISLLSNQLSSAVQSGLSQIQNGAFHNAVQFAQRGIESIYQTGQDLMTVNRAWDNYRRQAARRTDGQTFWDFLQLRGIDLSEDYVRSFLNSAGVAQDDMARGANFRDIVTRSDGTITNSETGNAGVMTGAFQQGVNNALNRTNAPTTTGPTTSAPTTTEPMGMQMVLSNAGGPTAGGQHGETGVDMVNYTKFHPFKRVEQVLMPYYKSDKMTIPASATSAVAITFRLNSIYDIIHAGATFTAIDPNITPPVADTPDAVLSREVPMMREYWKQFYSYWHVVKCEWKFQFRGKEFDRQTNVNKQLFFYEHGIQYPPLTQTVGGTNKLIPWHVRKYHPHVRQHTMKNPNADEQIHNTWQTITGTWRPGDIQHEVAEDELTRVWHKFEAVPPTAEKLTIMYQMSDGQPLDVGTHDLFYKMEMHYTVQLKDLKTQYEFITEETGIPAVASFNQRLE